MRQNYPECERRVLLSEGGYTNDPRDPGGPTNWGITIYDARAYWKPNATAQDVRAMPRSVASAIYKPKYWDALGCDNLPSGVDYAVFDYGVNSGINRARRVLQHICNGRDPNTLDARKLVDAICDERLQFLHHLSTWDHFGAGWGRRVASVKSYSEYLAEQPRPSVAPVPHVTGPEGMAKAIQEIEEVFCHPLEALEHAIRTPSTPAPEKLTSEAPIESPPLPEWLLNRDKAPDPQPESAPSMWLSKQGWVGIGVGSAGVSTALQQVNDMLSQVTSLKFTVSQLLANPTFIMGASLVAAAVFIWFEHRKYKNLVHELKQKS